MILSLYSLGCTLSRRELTEILARTTPQKGSKRKNTYTVKPAFFHKFKILEKIKTVPMPIVSVNGTRITNPFMSLNLPGDTAHKIATTLPHNTTYQITEYLDKYTLKPVLTLLPDMQILHHSTDYAKTLKRLNHASRRDLLRRIKTKQHNTY